MVNGFKIKKYWILTFCMVLCSLVTFAQNLSDQEIGFDVARVTKSFREHGVADQDILHEIMLMRDLYKTQYFKIKKNEDDFLQKLKSNKSVKNSTNRIDIPSAERNSLIALYNSTGGADWINKTGWDINNPDSDVSTWFGITVSNGKVVSINLNNNGLIGNIPDLSALTGLLGISLNYNNFSNTAIPSSFSQMKSLQYISIPFSNLNGIIPDLSELTNLKTLYLGGNFFNSSSMPSWISNSVNLETIALYNCNITGEIPDLSKLTKLTSLLLMSNKITGKLPLGLFSLPNLRDIWLNDNYLNGSIPVELGSLLNLEQFLVSNNHLESIPITISKLTNLKVLWCNGNQFEGDVPDLTKATSLSQLLLNNNKFRFIDFAAEYPLYKSQISTFYYSPQGKTDLEKTVAGVSGSTVTLTMCEDDRYIPNVDTFQWYKNGQIITGATARQYTISNLSAINAGDYYCVSTNPQIALILERNPIHLTVPNCTPKTGTLQVPAVQVVVGETAKFSFEQTAGTVVTGEAVKYKWTIIDTAGQTVNSTTTTVGTHSFVFSTDGKYTVNLVVTGADGCEATFTQEMTIVPEKKCLNENISFSFETTAPNLSYVWTSTNASGVVVNSSTASASSLYNVSFAMPGDYVIKMVATDTVTQCFETFTKNVTIESCAPTNCMVHFNFNFKIPDIGKGFGGLVLNLDSRMNIANGVVDFLKANSNKKLFATTFDMTNKGVNAVMVNKEITVSPGDVYKVGTANEISNNTPTVIRIQDNSYSNTFSTLINSGILKNSSLKKDDLDVSFFIISEDNNTSSLDGAKSAYKDLLSSGKAKKVFFVLVNEGKFSYVKRVGLVNRKVNISPIEFLTEIMGSTPINYAATNSILNSDFVQFSKADIANAGFKKVLSDFLQKGYDDVSSNCEDVESCTKKNINTPVLKKLFLTLVNKLKDIPAGSDANTYAQKELAALAPYTIDLKPMIYNFINTSSTISFSFSETSLENDVQLPKPVSGSIVDIDLSQYTDAGTKTPISTFFSDGKIDLTNGFVRNIDFCVKELSCVSHVALVLDESGSIDLKEMNKIKKQLKGFVYQQAITNEKIGSNIYISLTGMSDSDANTRADFIEPIKASTDPLVLNRLYTWIDDLGMRNGQTGVSAGSDYWNSGLDKALSYTLKPNAVIMITDGCQSANAGTLQATMKKFNNAKGSSSDLPHLYVVGIENGFYVDKPSTAKIMDRNEDPNYNTALQKRSLTAKVAARLTKSLQYLLGFTETEFPVSSISDFKTATYFGHDNFNLLASDETYISDKLADSDIVCGDSAIKDFCDDCFSFKPEPDHEYLLSAWVKEESFVQVKSYMNSAINIVFYRQKEALDVPAQIIATEIAVPSGEIIDGWQRIVKKIKVPTNAITIGFTLENKSASIPVYFDDIRIHPLKGSVKSFVYDPETFKLMSELDENNYSTFYEYDNEGGLVRVKKETAKGIKTIQETRSGNFINTKE